MNDFMRGQEYFKRRVLDILHDADHFRVIVSKMPLHGDAHRGPVSAGEAKVHEQLERARRVVEKHEPKGPKHVGDIFLGATQ